MMHVIHRSCTDKTAVDTDMQCIQKLFYHLKILIRSGGPGQLIYQIDGIRLLHLILPHGFLRQCFVAQRHSLVIVTDFHAICPDQIHLTSKLSYFFLNGGQIISVHPGNTGSHRNDRPDSLSDQLQCLLSGVFYASKYCIFNRHICPGKMLWNKSRVQNTSLKKASPRIGAETVLGKPHTAPGGMSQHSRIFYMNCQSHRSVKGTAKQRYSAERIRQCPFLCQYLHRRLFCFREICFRFLFFSFHRGNLRAENVFTPHKTFHLFF